MNYIVYVLCDVTARARCRHYIGIAKASRFRKRMAEHVNGTASQTTRRMLEQGARLELGRTYPTSDPGLERALKRNGHYERLCLRCRGELPLDLPAMPEKRKGDAATPPSWSPIGY